MKFLLVSSICSTIYIFIACFTFLGMIPYPLFLFLVFFPFVTVVIVKIIKECKQYGKENVFRFLKKTGNEADRRDIFLKSLKEQLNSQVLISDGNPRMIIIVNSNGIFLYSFLQDIGTFYEKDNQWYLKDGRSEREVLNPMKELEDEKKCIEEILSISILDCIVLDTFTHLQKENRKSKVLNITNSFYYICKTNLLVRLSDNQIENIVDKITRNLQYKRIKKEETEC